MDTYEQDFLDEWIDEYSDVFGFDDEDSTLSDSKAYDLMIEHGGGSDLDAWQDFLNEYRANEPGKAITWIALLQWLGY